MRSARSSLCPTGGFRTPDGWSLTVLRTGEDARVRGIYTASCGGTLLMTIDRVSVVFEVRLLSAVDEAMEAGKALLRALDSAGAPAALLRPSIRPLRRVEHQT